MTLRAGRSAITCTGCLGRPTYEHGGLQRTRRLSRETAGSPGLAIWRTRWWHRIDLKRRRYEYSREDVTGNRVEQANYLYSWANMMWSCPAFTDGWFLWLSDYHFTNALRYRLFDEGTTAASDVTPAKSLLLRGGVDAESDVYLEPVFIVDAPAALPDSVGEYRVTGRTTSGDELFSLSFGMPQTADGDASSSFVFALPARPGWADNLATVTLSGPDGSVTLDGQSTRPMAILRDPEAEAERPPAGLVQVRLSRRFVRGSGGSPDRTAA